MKTLLLFTMFFASLAWSAKQPVSQIRTLSGLYAKINDGSLKLKDYHLMIKSWSKWNGVLFHEAKWAELAKLRTRGLNIVVVYDGVNQDTQVIQSKKASENILHYYDQDRYFYYWFKNNSILDAVLIGPKGEILFDGVLSAEKIKEIENLVKTK